MKKTVGPLLLAPLLRCGTPGTHGETGTAGESTAVTSSEDGGTTEPATSTETAADTGTASEAATATGTTGDTEPVTRTTGDTGTTDMIETTGDSSTRTTGESSTDETGTNGDTGRECLPECLGPADPYVDCLISFDPAPATVAAGGYNHDALPDVVLGPPGASADVVALGCGGQIVLGFAEPVIVDGAGADFIVFENPFNVSFPEPGRVEVSADGCAWSAFPCDPTTLAGCAGKSVTKATPNSGLDPTDPAVAGGDAFDLADVGLDLARYVRIVDVSDAYWSAMDMSFCDPGQGGKAGFDLDAIAVVDG